MQQEKKGERIMEIRKITGIVPADKRAVETAFGSIEPQPVACCNWPEQYPYAPEVSFRMFHTGAYLMLRFDVREQWTMAVTGPSKAKCDAISLKFSFMAYDFLLFPRYYGCTPQRY